MFEEGRFSPRRRVNPPTPVLVELGALWPPERLRWGQDTPLWVRSGGVQLNSAVRGVAEECVLTSAGDWLVLCSYEVRVGRTALQLLSLLRPAALRPRRGHGKG